MSEDASVNTGATAWPSDGEAFVAVRRMQNKLHCWAGADGARRFDDLYNLVCDPKVLAMAWERVAGNKGARTAGTDRATVAWIVSRYGVETFLHDIRDQLRSRTFTPAPVRRVMIPKASGKLRALGIPTVTDRVVQAALKLVLEPIFEADFAPVSYGFRPNRRAQDAIAEIHYFGAAIYTSGCWRPTSRRVWMLHHTAPSANCGDQNRPSWGFGGWMRRPFRRPVRTCTAWSSPRLTRCNRVWRDTP